MDAEINLASYVVGCLAELEEKPTFVVGLGASSIQTARKIADLTGLPCGVSIDAPVVGTSEGVIVGVVSGTDDLSFWNSNLIHEIGLSQSALQTYSQVARIEAIREFHSLSLSIKALPRELDRETVLCVLTSPLSTYTRYQLALLRQRRPDRIILLAWDHKASSFVESGLVEKMIPLQCAEVVDA